MNTLQKFFLLVKEIGLADLTSFGLYQFQLRSGLLGRRTPVGGKRIPEYLDLKSSDNQFTWQENWEKTNFSSSQTLNAGEPALLLENKFRPFFGSEEPLSFPRIESIDHWTAYSNEFKGKDIKFTWEPARFIWSLALAQAYRSTGDERYPELFWQKFEEFTATNPVNSGPNWASAQEVALRSIMWILTVSAFKNSPATTNNRLKSLMISVRNSVERILPTLPYARSQHNNHLLSEALGLVLGGEFLKGADPRANNWIEVGKREFEGAILSQVDGVGNYSQHSANYHRMMLQLALLYTAYMGRSGTILGEPVREKLSLASRWLIAQLDTPSGRMPNLGHNDGTLLLPFGGVEFRDYRPTAQAAAIAFLGHQCLPAGPWDELPAWLGLESSASILPPHTVSSPAIHKVGSIDCWATLRGVKYQNRPAHADQLHVEIWQRGENLALDAGTYLYNAPTPWQNKLDSTRVHNTITVDGKDQMHRVSRFLWLERAQANWLKAVESDEVTAAHNGYRKLGITHQRAIKFYPPAGFLITDTLTPALSDPDTHIYQLHWLLPDRQWQLSGSMLTFDGDENKIKFAVKAVDELTSENLNPTDISIIRGGETISGVRRDEILGWESDTYGEKHPAISFSVSYQHSGKIQILTKWNMMAE